MVQKEYFSPIGRMIITADNNALTDLSFSDISCENTDNDITEMTEKWLDIYFSGNIPEFTPPVSLSGTPFQLMIWEMLRAIPYGSTVSYKDIAKQAAKKQGKEKMSSQAVGGAVGRNPIAIIIPCHRVIGSDGSLTGYAGGLDKKTYLLRLENKVKYS
ncbi:MAG: methylated-DNA--[protein]-cysteine S-methyltransferase [Oscillospiraceae bacterium]|nr:methylated-DNA--[protein]-cysteine S-methyltransferase [Oscillospiraceae bacterium]